MPESPFLGELFGTLILILLGDGVVAAVLLNKSKAQNAGWIVITAGWAFAVMAGIFVSQAFTGPGSLNPAGIIAGIVRDPSTLNEGVMLIAAQLIGAFLGAVLVWLHYMPHWAETDDPGLKLAIFSTGPAIRNPATNTVSEIIGTYVLILVASVIATNVQGLGSFLVGSLVWGIGLSLGGPTGYAINPARDLGPRIAHFLLPIPGKGDSDWSYAWVPVVGPIIGAVLAALAFVPSVGPVISLVALLLVSAGLAIMGGRTRATVTTAKATR